MGPKNEAHKNHVSKTYITQRIVKNKKCMGTGKAGFTKDSSLSPERARASNPAIMSCFTKEVMKKDAELIAEGVFPPGGVPAERIFNLDETGFDPKGKFAPTCGITRMYIYAKGNNSISKRKATTGRLSDIADPYTHI